VAPEWLLIANGLDELIGMICRWRRIVGPLLIFPPSDPVDEERARNYGLDVITLQRSPSFTLALNVDTAAELDYRATALVVTPNDPTGTQLSSQEAVRLARACSLVVIDERHGAYANRSFVPLAREFDNVIVLQTFETWAGLTGFPVAFAIAPPRILDQLRGFQRRDGVAMGAVLAALATLDDRRFVRANVDRVRAERARLFRMLRKLNLVQPLPSWANFLLARVERGSADWLAGELARRGIFVHRPPHPELARYIRISATKPEHTDRLRRALIQISVDL
jgi:histidinol-phosphate aminotransferase